LRVATLAAGLVLPAFALADDVRLRDQSVVHGTVLAVTATTLELDRCGVRETYLRSMVEGVGFAPQSCATSPAMAEGTSELSGLPAATALTVRLRAPVDSEKEPVGQVFAGYVREAVMQGPRVIVPQGAPVLLELRADPGTGLEPRPALLLIALRDGIRWRTLAPALALDVERTRAGSSTADALQLGGPRLAASTSVPLVFVVPGPLVAAGQASMQRP